jgi:2-hydroxy-3-keto-5-methylthiopentenyl-1-phosphate phosphatase
LLKTAVQCDFDGTITVDDVSFLLLDAFADGDWRQLWEDYVAGRISVGVFNTRAFAMVKADKRTLLDYMFRSGKVQIRPGFRELLDYCSRQDFEFIIVSNGLEFYIEAILADMGMGGIKVFAAQNRFSTTGMKVSYIGPDGNIMEAGFKEAYTRLLKKRGYRIVCVGNGSSDIYPARQSDYVFATGDLLKRCREEKLVCTPFQDFHDVVTGLEALSSA